MELQFVYFAPTAFIAEATYSNVIIEDSQSHFIHYWFSNICLESIDEH